uniref:ADAM_CR_2 domain-containing protein n=1 Tax=Globodera pallida TaxID=36090 RepID=A0A183BI59_GLOPA
MKRVLNRQQKGQVGSTESKHHILTKWGCTDKMPNQLLDKPEQFIGQNATNRIIVHKCTPKVGKANIPMSNAGTEVPIPSQKCKKAFLSKWLNESSDKSCSQSQRYCYVLNCSTAVESDKPGQIMTEWGCTDRQYGTGENACYTIHCFHTEHLKNPVKEWGCTSNASQICAQKISEFGYNMSNKNETCNCSFDTAKQKRPLKKAMKMKSSDVEGGWHHASDQRALAGSSDLDVNRCHCLK